MNQGQWQELFLFAAKAGSLEGYLYHRRKAEPLAKWIDNIEGMYQNLSSEARNEINPAFSSVLQKILEYGRRVLEPSLRKKLEQMLATASTGA